MPFSQLPQHSSFQTTCWTLIERVAAGDESQKALDELMRVYWYPLYAFCRRQGYSDHDAMDYTQGFLVSIIENDVFAKANSSRGRFRNFLLVSFKNYLHKQHREVASQKRGGNISHLPLELAQFSIRYGEEVWDQNESPDQHYERQCVVNFLKEVQESLRQAYYKAGKQQLFDTLSPLILDDVSEVDRERVAQQLGLSSPAISMALKRMRLKYAQILRIAVSRNLEHGTSVEEELQDLLRVVTK